MARIVLVDDDAAVRGILATIIERAGYDVACFAEPASVFTELDFASVDLLVTDLWMPTPGEDFVTEVRNLGYRTPILVLTGRLEIDQDEIMSIGVDRVMQKPVSAGKLLEAIKDLFDSRRKQGP